MASAPTGLRVAEATPYQPHDPIVIDGDDGFTAANGVVGGNGTASSPYVIENWHIDAVWPNNGAVIGNTSAHFVVQNIDISTTNSTGVLLANVTNARLENLQIHGTDRRKQGIWMTQVTNSLVRGSNLTNYDVAFLMTFVDRIKVLDNIFPSNLGGISLGFSTNVTISGNMFTFNGLVIFGSSRAHLSSHTITPDNLVNGKPLRYYAGCRDLNLDGIEVGQLIIADCQNVRVANLQLSSTDTSFQMTFVQDALVIGNNITDNTIVGFAVTYSTNITVTGNNISDNLHGLRVFSSAGVRVFHNNLGNRMVQAWDNGGSGNSWDDGYPNGGNYWSTYTGKDNCNGPGQNVCSGPDGLGDTAYVIDSDTKDRYPLMQPYATTHDIAITNVEVSATSVTKGETVTITVTVKNEGNVAESFNVTVLAEAIPFDSRNVADLVPRTIKTLLFYWETAAVAPGSYTVKAIADTVPGEVDAADNTRSAPPVAVNRVELAPVLNPIGDRTVPEGTLLTFNATASDGNGDPLAFSVGPNAPRGAAVTSGGIFSWIPTEDQGEGSYQVTIIVRDPTGRSDSEVVSITVREVNEPPVLNAVSDKTVNQGSILRFTATASDPDLPVQPLVFSLERSASGTFPEGAVIAADGKFTWTPGSDQEPGTYAVRIVVSDGGLTDSEDVVIIVEQRQPALLTGILSWLPWVSIGLAGVVASLVLLLRRFRGSRDSQESGPGKTAALADGPVESPSSISAAEKGTISYRSG